MKIVDVSVTLLDHMGSDLSVVNAARVSFDKVSEYTEAGTLNAKDQKLIQYLASHGHWSPFAHCFAQFRIKAPIFVARQLIKHQIGLSWNEVSRRYVDSEPEFYIPSMRRRAENVKQGSDDELVFHHEDLHDEWVKAAKASLLAYKNALDLNLAPEIARSILPQFTMTEWIWSGSLMAFARVCNQRMEKSAQKESAMIAAGINGEMTRLFPYSWKALRKEGEA